MRQRKLTEKDLKLALDYSIGLWKFLYNNPKKEKKDYCYWNTIVDYLNQCPLCEVYLKLYEEGHYKGCDEKCPLAFDSKTCYCREHPFSIWLNQRKNKRDPKYPKDIKVRKLAAKEILNILCDAKRKLLK